MTADELHALVQAGESATVEIKKSTGQLSEAMRTTCAMLNGRGGFVLIGVTPAGKVVGQDVVTKTLEDVHNELRRIAPPAFPDVETLEVSPGKTVLLLRVPGSGPGPFVYDDRPYVRNGPTTIAMPQALYERKLLERMHPTARWENQPAAGVAAADLDRTEVVRTVEEAIRRGRMDDPGTRDTLGLLRGLNLLADGAIVNAAVVLFARPEHLPANYPQCLLRMARFRGTDKADLLDNRQEYGNAFDLLLRGQRFLRDHLPIAGRVVPSVFERIDDPLYPPVALREALANAICHRDYGVGGGSVGVALYADRLEVTSTGGLPFGQTPDDLNQPHPSRPWNPLIANAFYRRGVIEQWGRGTLKIRELTRQAGLVDPEIEANDREVVFRFFPTGYVAPERVGHDLSPLQRRLLEILADHGPLPLGRILAHLPSGTVRRTVQENLKMLAHLGLVDAPTRRGVGAVWRLKGAPTDVQ